MSELKWVNYAEWKALRKFYGYNTHKSMKQEDIETAVLGILKEHSNTIETKEHGTVHEINICLFSDIKNYIIKILKDNDIEVYNESKSN